MKYLECQMDLFTVGDEYTFAHCISADFGMGKGIAVEFNRRFDMKNKLIRAYPDYLTKWSHCDMIGGCILHENVLNLVTKKRYYSKPTYDSLREALEAAKFECARHGIQKIAMPKIGCGLDRLEWNRVRDIIQAVFRDTDIEIKVCFYE